MVDNVLSQQESRRSKFHFCRRSPAVEHGDQKRAAVSGGGGAVHHLRLYPAFTSCATSKQRLKEEFYRAERTHGQLSLMILDIDHFKRFNDTYGIPRGTRSWRTVAERVLANARKIDLTARYGGDEFLSCCRTPLRTTRSTSPTVCTPRWR